MHPFGIRVVVVVISICLTTVFLRQFATVSVDEVYQFSQPVPQEDGTYGGGIDLVQSEPISEDSKEVIQHHGSATVSAPVTPSKDTKAAASSSAKAVRKRPDVGIVSMLYGKPNDYYVQAIESHKRHASRHGYPAYVLRKNVYPLDNGIWNKLAFLLHLLVAELEKPEEERTRWLMWVDADSIVVNPALSLDIFLPPKDFRDVHVLATKDMNGLNAGIFFIHVHHWSLQMIIKAISIPQHRPDIGLGFLEQTALYMTFNDTEFRESVIYQPRIWFNTYEFHHAYEGKRGDFLVHMPGLEKDRWPHMEKWLDIINGPEQAEWEVPFEETRYRKEIPKYWNTLRYVRAVLKYADYQAKGEKSLAENIVEAVEDLRVTFLYASDALKKLTEKAEKVQILFEEREGNGTDTKGGLDQLIKCHDDFLKSPESRDKVKPSCRLKLEG